MESVDLYTLVGKGLAVKVVTVIVPPFRVRPDAILWGNRIFLWRPEHHQYREGFAFYALVEKEGS